MEAYIGKICPFCKTEIKEDDAVKVCPACGIPHHEECWQENGGCTTFGCTQQHFAEQHTNPTKVCANCGAPIGDSQAFCPKCGTPQNAIKKPICSACGTELAEGQAFCMKCGQPANVANADTAINRSVPNVTMETEQTELSTAPEASEDVNSSSQAEATTVAVTADDPAEPMSEPVVPPSDSQPKEECCVYCGAPLAFGNVFCAKCGRRQTELEQPVQVPLATTEKPGKKKKTIWLFVALAVVLAVGLFFLLRPIPVTEIELSATELTVAYSETTEIHYTLQPENTTQKKLRWSSNDESVAVVEDGILIPKDGGTCIITAEASSGVTAKCTVTVTVEVSDLSIPSAITITCGKSRTISCTVAPDNATDKTISWSSSDKSVATVNNGRITAVAPGSCVITASSSNNKKDTCTVTVSLYPQEKAIVGSWQMRSIFNTNTYNSVRVSSYYWYLYLYEDLTGKLYYGDTAMVFTWSYEKTDDEGDYVYQLHLNDGDKTTMWKINSIGEVWVSVGDYLLEYD